MSSELYERWMTFCVSGVLGTRRGNSWLHGVMPSGLSVSRISRRHEVSYDRALAAGLRMYLMVTAVGSFKRDDEARCVSFCVNLLVEPVLQLP